jgi:outer membrane protein assembly factor BamB
LKKHLLSLAFTAAASAASVLGGGGCGHRETPPSSTGEITTLPVQSFRRDWSADLLLKDDAVEHVYLREDMVVAYSKKHTAYVMNKAGGAIRFTAELGQSVVPVHEPLVLKDRIVFPTEATLELYRRDGRFERSYKTSSTIRTNAAAAPTGNKLYFGVDARNSGRLVAVDTVPSQYRPVNETWELMSDRAAPIFAAPAVAAGVVYAAFGDGEVYAVNADSRAAIWATSTGQTFQTYGPVKGDLRVDDFGLYVASADTKFYCLDKTQGRKKWEFYAGGILKDTPEVTSTMVYLPVQGRGVVAIDKTNGPTVREAKWTIKDAVKLLAEDERYAYLQRSDNVVLAIEKATGEQRFTSRRTDFVAFATNTKDSTIYAATKTGQVVAITPVLKPGNVGELALEVRGVEAVAMR